MIKKYCIKSSKPSKIFVDILVECDNKWCGFGWDFTKLFNYGFTSLL